MLTINEAEFQVETNANACCFAVELWIENHCSIIQLPLPNYSGEGFCIKNIVKYNYDSYNML